jgi:diguanylate cyclase (GGDEF)-like protein
MGLKNKLNLTTAGFTLIIIITLSSFLLFLINRNFYRLEERFIEDKISTVENFIIRDFEELEFILTDWAEWDLTYAYVKDLQPEYIEENLSEDILSDLALDYLFILDDHGNLKFGLMKENNTEEVILLEHKNIMTFLDYPNQTGMLFDNGEIIMFASIGITDNNAEMPPVGQLCFAKRVDEAYIDHLESSTDLRFNLSMGQSTNDTANSADDQAYSIHTELEHFKRDYSRFIVEIPFLNNSRYIKFDTTVDNSIQSLGKKFMTSVLSVIIGIMILFGFLFNYVFGKVVVQRLLALNQQIGFIRDTRDTKERLGSHGVDEIGELGENINLMLEEIDRNHDELSKFATFDEMTGVYNRRVGLDILAEVIRNFDEYEIPFSVIYLDLDGLKKINDVFGHSVGDQMIKTSVEIVLNIIPEPRYVVRLGGDEFLIILKKHTYEEAVTVEKNISEAIAEYNKTTEHVYSVSFSMGTVEYERTMALEGILETADKEMYQSKEKKKHSILDQ